MSRIAIRLLALGLPALWSAGTGLTAPAPEVDPFAIDASWPLAKGAVWVYEARVEWQDDKGVHTRKLGWRSEVLETTWHKDVAAARLRGDPADLAWFEEGRQPRVHVIFRVGAARYHRLMDDKAEAAWSLLQAGEMEELQALLTEETIELELPLVRDKIIGRPNLMTARRYCDLVTNSITFWEWCLDGYQWRLPGGLDPVLTDSDRRVIRGGSWSVNGDSCRAAMRGRSEPGQAATDVGLRPIITRVK